MQYWRVPTPSEVADRAPAERRAGRTAISLSCATLRTVSAGLPQWFLCAVTRPAQVQSGFGRAALAKCELRNWAPQWDSAPLPQR
jgi:hypothetical protein